MVRLFQVRKVLLFVIITTTTLEIGDELHVHVISNLYNESGIANLSKFTVTFFLVLYDVKPNLCTPKLCMQGSH